MFFAEDRIKAVREMICARTVEEREAALAKVEPFQQGDFEAMYRIMGERPMTIRYLDRLSTSSCPARTRTSRSWLPTWA